ncbi:hypothetical protein [Paeniroseomonas aquatica]|uniref:hypothetical protein n=1 Tax=Paeniroseomonas aquatica TaxID=373043 RepID=UPI0025B3FBC6|nr:hypothetical protein [Paeniroseomonas aquatica]
MVHLVAVENEEAHSAAAVLASDPHAATLEDETSDPVTRLLGRVHPRQIRPTAYKRAQPAPSLRLRCLLQVESSYGAMGTKRQVLSTSDGKIWLDF